MKRITIIGAMLMALLGLGGVTQPVAALGEANVAEVVSASAVKTATALSTPAKTLGTFGVTETKDGVSVQVGANLLLAGNQVMNDTTVRGILFAFGNGVSAGAKSEYAFIAGNNVDIYGQIEKDLFVAGNSVKINRTAEIGRDVYAAVSGVTVDADLKGDFSASADVVVLNNVKIDGDVDLAVSRLLINGDTVKIGGTLIVNADAEIVNSASNFEYSEIERYEVVHYDLAPAAIVTVKTISIVGLFVAMLIILLVFPRVDKKVAKEISGTQMLVDMLIGFCMLVLIPVVCAILLITIIAAPAAILLLAVYIIMVYIAQGFSGLWLGKLIVERIFGWEGHKLFETLLGIVILGFASLAPIVGGWIGFFSLLLGLGLIVQSVRNKQVGRDINWGPRDEDEEIAEAKVVKSSTKNDKVKTQKTTARKTAAKKPKTTKKED